MSKATFKTNPVHLETLLKQCAEGKIQLPDFQRQHGARRAALDALAEESQRLNLQ